MQVERQQEQRRDAILQAVSAASTVRNRITQAEERIVALDREAQRLQGEITAAKQQLESFGGQRGQLGLEFESASQLCHRFGRTDRRSRDNWKQAAQPRPKPSDTSIAAREYASLMGKKGSLEAVIAEHGYSTESVRKLFTSGSATRRRARPECWPISSKSKTATSTWSTTSCATS